MSATAVSFNTSAAAVLALTNNAPGFDGGAAEAGAPLQLFRTGLDGANFSYGSTEGDSLTVKFGPSNVGENGSNGYKSIPDLSTLRGLFIRAKSTAGSAPEWAGVAGTSVTLGFLADCGEPGSLQTAAANHVAAWSPDGTFLVGDFSYNVEAGGGTALTSDVAAFSDEITAETLFPIPGNHEWDRGAGLPALLAAKFPYIANFDTPPADSGTCYDQIFKGDAGDASPLVHVLCLDAMQDSTGADFSGGNPLCEWGDKWDWLMGRIANYPDARFRVAMVHFPAVTSVAQNSESDNGVKENLAFLARSGLFDLIICGHIHSTERLTHFGTTVINASSCVQAVRVAGAALSGAAAEASLLYSNSSARTVGKITATPDALTWQIHEVGGSVLDSGTILPRAQCWGAFEVAMTGVSAASGETTGENKTNRFLMHSGDVVFLQFRNGHPVLDNTASAVVASRRSYGAGTAANNMRNMQLEIFAIGR